MKHTNYLEGMCIYDWQEYQNRYKKAVTFFLDHVFTLDHDARTRVKAIDEHFHFED